MAVSDAASAANLGHRSLLRVRVILPTPLVDYTAGLREVAASGSSLAAVLHDLDRQYPGIRFRIIDEQGLVRPHIKLFIDRELERDLATQVSPDAELLIVAALSGG